MLYLAVCAFALWMSFGAAMVLASGRVAVGVATFASFISVACLAFLAFANEYVAQATAHLEAVSLDLPPRSSSSEVVVAVAVEDPCGQLRVGRMLPVPEVWASRPVRGAQELC